MKISHRPPANSSTVFEGTSKVTLRILAMYGAKIRPLDAFCTCSPLIIYVQIPFLVHPNTCMTHLFVTVKSKILHYDNALGRGSDTDGPHGHAGHEFLGSDQLKSELACFNDNYSFQSFRNLCLTWSFRHIAIDSWLLLQSFKFTTAKIQT